MVSDRINVGQLFHLELLVLGNVSGVYFENLCLYVQGLWLENEVVRDVEEYVFLWNFVGFRITFKLSFSDIFDDFRSLAQVNVLYDEIRNFYKTYGLVYFSDLLWIHWAPPSKLLAVRSESNSFLILSLNN
jgi:hypothetical protein